jgi:hypothetical protein
VHKDPQFARGKGKPACKHRWRTIHTHRVLPQYFAITDTLHIMECERCQTLGTKIERIDLAQQLRKEFQMLKVDMTTGVLNIPWPKPPKKRGIP